MSDAALLWTPSAQEVRNLASLAAHRALSAAGSITLADDGKIIDCDATSAAFTVSLAARAALGKGRRFLLRKKDSSANAITIDPNGSETIDGAATLSLTRQYQCVLLVVTDTEFAAVPLAAGSSLKPFTVSGGVAMAYGAVGYIHTDGTVRPARQDVAPTDPECQVEVICLTPGGVASGSSGVFGAPGTYVEGLSGTAGQLQYLTTGGAYNGTLPTIGVIAVVGRFVTSSCLLFRPRDPYYAS